MYKNQTFQIKISIFVKIIQNHKKGAHVIIKNLPITVKLASLVPNGEDPLQVNPTLLVSLKLKWMKVSWFLIPVETILILLFRTSFIVPRYQFTVGTGKPKKQLEYLIS